jgi:hypothetical protein
MPSASSGPAIMKKGLVIAVLTTACNFANAQDRGIVQNWNSDYTAREWLVDCDQKRDQCYFLLAQSHKHPSGSTNAFRTVRASRKLQA